MGYVLALRRIWKGGGGGGGGVVNVMSFERKFV